MLQRYNLSYFNFVLYIQNVNVSVWIGYRKTLAFVLLFKLVGAIKIITCAKVMKLKKCVCVRERERENGIGLNVYKLKRWEYDLKDSQHVFHFQICYKFLLKKL